MKYVLIFVITTATSGGPSTAEFDDLDACEDARKVIAEYWDGHDSTAGGVCLPKASQ